MTNVDKATWKILTETDEDVVPPVKITGTEYQAFVFDWYGGKHPHERFGQAFVNKFLRVGPVRIPNLFYATDESVAKQIIVDTFVDWSQ